MTKLLIRLFIKDPQNTQNDRVREAYGRLAGIVGGMLQHLSGAGQSCSSAPCPGPSPSRRTLSTTCRTWAATW